MIPMIEGSFKAVPWSYILKEWMDDCLVCNWLLYYQGNLMFIVENEFLGYGKGGVPRQ